MNKKKRRKEVYVVNVRSYEDTVCDRSMKVYIKERRKSSKF